MSTPQTPAARREPAWLPTMWCLVFGTAVAATMLVPVNAGDVIFLDQFAALESIPRPAWAVLWGAAAAAALWMADRRWWPLLIVGLVSAVTESLSVGMVVASYVVASRYRHRATLAGYVVAASVVATLPHVLSALAGAGGWELPGIVSTAFIAVILPVIVGLWIRARREVVAGLRERAQRLEAEQDAASQRARADERSRIAREMHDVVAHQVSLMVLYAGAVRVNATDATTATNAELIRSTGTEALTQLRDVLKVLKNDDDTSTSPQPTWDDVAAMVDRFATAGMDVRRCESGQLQTPLPPIVVATVHRVVREALTNAHKHAGGASIVVGLEFGGHGVRVNIRNAPPPAPLATLPGTGSGLDGLRERVALLGGTFRAGAHSHGGFEVDARIPATIDAPPEAK